MRNSSGGWIFEEEKSHCKKNPAHSLLKQARDWKFWLGRTIRKTVVLRCRDFEPSEESILYAARVAAGFSKARDSSNVPVDYTRVKFLKKPNGARPGFVIFTHQKTILVEPFQPIHIS